MNESQAGNQAVSMVVKLYLGILMGIPELFHAFQDYKTMNYNRELVEQEIVRSGNAVIIAADDRAMEFVRVKLQEKGICFAMAQSNHEALKEMVKANGKFLFLCREADYERVVEAVYAVERDFSREDQEMEAEEGLERDRTEPTEEEETRREEEEGEFHSEDEGSEKSGEEAKHQEKKKRKRKKKKGGSSGIPSEHVRPSQGAANRDPPEQDRKELSAPEPYRVPETTRYHDREESYRKRKNEYSRPDSDKKGGYSGTQKAGFTGNQAGTADHQPVPGHAAQKDGLADADRNRVTDFHDKTRTEGESREELIQSSRFILSSSKEDGHVGPDCHTHQKAKSRYADNRSVPEGRQAGFGEKGECLSARSTAADPAPYTGKEPLDSTRPQTKERTTSSVGQIVFLGNSSLMPDSSRSTQNSRYGCLTCSNGMSVPPFTCDFSYYKNGCWHWEYEWVYECGGHMGLVVYVTIGDLSRMPGFAAAGDVDYESVGNYDVQDVTVEEATENAPQTAGKDTQ